MGSGILPGGGIEGRSDGASPLQREGGGDFLFGGKAEFFDPLSDFSVAGAALGFEGGAHFEVSKLAAGDHEEPEGNAVGGMRLGGCGDGAMMRRRESWPIRAVSRHWGRQ